MRWYCHMATLITPAVLPAALRLHITGANGGRTTSPCTLIPECSSIVVKVDKEEGCISVGRYSGVPRGLLISVRRSSCKRCRVTATPGRGYVLLLSGEIPRVTSYEKGLPGHRKRSADGTEWEPDPLLMDERFVAVHAKGKGMIVFSCLSSTRGRCQTC